MHESFEEGDDPGRRTEERDLWSVTGLDDNGDHDHRHCDVDQYRYADDEHHDVDGYQYDDDER